MTVIGFLSTAPATEDSMAKDVANAVEALEDFDVEYETGPMGTTIEAPNIGELLDAVQAAHEAVDGDRVSTFLKIDDKRSSEESAAEKVAAVEEHLGHTASSDRSE
ncbi:MTH1187 family thiamine-binding protein [Halobacteria archaeon AArc-curdl1]|uniref:MTH1187 family thiamine-binding protein n=1 Tax=Natronosalvus hydrolyticus TaxID=2979988 RepID=A0AAP2ZAQ8_9EURY|nr:MTH1187 family thiamine-binding protein [Halobacteria archaeon AArc-curdl1]